MPFQHTVGKGHQVIIIHSAVTGHQEAELVPPAVAAGGIAEEYIIAPGCPHLHFMHIGGAIGGFGPAVNDQNGGVLLAGFLMDRMDYPPLHQVSMRIHKVAGLGLRDGMSLRIRPSARGSCSRSPRP